MLLVMASRARPTSACAAAATFADVPARVGDEPGVCGCRGSGGGLRSGSELSHLFLPNIPVSGMLLQDQLTHGALRNGLRLCSLMVQT